MIVRARKLGDKKWQIIRTRFGYNGERVSVRGSFAVNVMTVHAWLARSLRLILYCFGGAQGYYQPPYFPRCQNQSAKPVYRSPLWM